MLYREIVIKLGPAASVVLGYMKSCRRETISGIGTVIVGKEESKVHLADVEGDKTECDSAQAHATTRATSDVAATVVRSLTKKRRVQAPQLTLYGTSPLVEAKGRGTLVFERLDQKGERQQFDLTGNQLKGKFYDLAGTSQSLTPGGTYAATFASPGSCSASIPRPSPVRRRSSAACCVWNRLCRASRP